jgi:hypothetical protein
MPATRLGVWWGMYMPISFSNLHMYLLFRSVAGACLPCSGGIGRYSQPLEVAWKLLGAGSCSVSIASARCHPDVQTHGTPSLYSNSVSTWKTPEQQSVNGIRRELERSGEGVVDRRPYSLDPLIGSSSFGGNCNRHDPSVQQSSVLPSTCPVHSPPKLDLTLVDGIHDP